MAYCLQGSERLISTMAECAPCREFVRIWQRTRFVAIFGFSSAVLLVASSFSGALSS